MCALNIPISFYQKMFSREQNANTILFSVHHVPVLSVAEEQAEPQ